jgi:hypothetical protein
MLRFLLAYLEQELAVEQMTEKAREVGLKIAGLPHQHLERVLGQVLVWKLHVF